MAAALCRDYELYWILRWSAANPQLRSQPATCTVSEVEHAQVQSLVSQPLREQAWYAGEDARAFLAAREGEPAGLCFYWYGARYRQRNFWPLQPGEAKLVQVFVEPRQRGQGVAAALIAHSARTLAACGFHTLYARVWHSNLPSLHAFHRAGWQGIALVATGYPLGLRWHLRVVLPPWAARGAKHEARGRSPDGGRP